MHCILLNVRRTEHFPANTISTTGASIDIEFIETKTTKRFNRICSIGKIYQNIQKDLTIGRIRQKIQKGFEKLVLNIQGEDQQGGKKN